MIKPDPECPHENRFIAYNLNPEVSSKNRRVKVPKLYPQTHKLPEKSQYFAVMSQVTPNKDAVMKTVSNPINFGRMSERKDLFSPTSLSPPSYDIKFEVLEKHIRSPNLGSSLGRKFGEVPCYMNSMSNRFGLEEKSWKSLEMNCYGRSGQPSLENTQRNSKIATICIEDLQDLPLIDSFFA